MTKNEWISAVGLLISLAYISFLSVSKESYPLASINFIYGAVFASIAGIGQVIVVFYSRRILDRGVRPHEILQFRFFAIILICVVVIIFKKIDLLDFFENIYVFLIIGFLFIAFPLYLLQWGIKGTDTVTVNIIVACIPLMVIFLELINKNISFYPRLFFAVLFGVGFLIYGVYGKVSVTPSSKKPEEVIDE